MEARIPLTTLSLETTPQLSDPNDDWTGKTNADDRRRLQNRLNQRTQLDTCGRSLGRRKKLQQEHLSALSATNNGFLLLPCPQQRARFIAFTERAYMEYSLNAPRPTYLPVLIRLNVLNALSQNAAALGFQLGGLCHDEAISPFNQFGPRLSGQLKAPPSSPKSLYPTTVQLTVTHHPWFDLLPFPRMRDNMLNYIAAEKFNEDEVCYDLLYVGDEFFEEKPSLLVWGQLWDVRSWDVSVAFPRKWGWLIQGCPELIESTSYWREKRGEKRLTVRL
ncbi:hypothetical protein EDB80DRAFT_762214 [Ilyonectria destructans]|nr:hypothetical protein EDB80DRAFT_762214 [Ilyonectria destructans]